LDEPELQEPEFEPLPLLLDVAQKHYESVLANSRALDAKGAIFAATFGVLLLAVMDSVEFNIGFLSQPLPLISLVAVVGGFVASLAGIRMRTYTIVPSSAGVRKMYAENWSLSKVQIQLMAHYIIGAEETENAMTGKAKWLRLSYFLIFVSIVSLIALKFVGG